MTTLLDWDDIRFVLAVMRHGTLLRAARELKVTQPTVGRRIDALERRLGAKLFRRLRSGYSPLPEAESARIYAEQSGHRVPAHALRACDGIPA